MNKENYRRRSIRLPTYDYSQEGWYFVTILDCGRMKLEIVFWLTSGIYIKVPNCLF